jgi:hypothetical protein
MTDTKARETFTHPLLDRIDEEKRAMRGVLKALDGLDEKGALDVLSRVWLALSPEAPIMVSAVPGFGTANGISGGIRTDNGATRPAST